MPDRVSSDPRPAVSPSLKEQADNLLINYGTSFDQVPGWKLNSAVNLAAREAMALALKEAEKAVEERITKVADEICKGESATANHALLTHIAIPQAREAIASLRKTLEGQRD